jgi:hypothetical protein
MTEENKPTVQLTGRDGHAFAVMGACKKAAKAAGWTPEKITQVLEEMTSGDYDQLLGTAMKYFDVE